MGKHIRVLDDSVFVRFSDPSAWAANLHVWGLQMRTYGSVAPRLLEADEDRLELRLERLAVVDSSFDAPLCYFVAPDSLADCLFRMSNLQWDRFSWRIGSRSFPTWGEAVLDRLSGLDANYRLRTGQSPPPQVQAAAEYLTGVFEGQTASQPERSSLSHGDVHPANLGWRSAHEELWLLDFDLAGWRDPVFDLAKVCLRSRQDDPGWSYALAERVAQNLGLASAEMEQRLRWGMLLECTWGLAFHLQYQTAAAPVWWDYLCQSLDSSWT